MRTALTTARLLQRVAVIAATSILLLLVVASAALAHVTVRADNPAPGAFAKYTIRVPNESDTAATTEVEVQFPEGFEPGLVKPVPGWDIAIEDGVMTIEGGRIEPGQFAEFEFTARNPETATTLTFPAIQTYEDGEVARWVGEPDTDEPAPEVELVAAGGDEPDAAETDTETWTPQEPSTAAPDEAADGNGLTIAALVAALVAAGMSAVALLSARRR